MENKYYYYFKEDLDLETAIKMYLTHKQKNPNTKFIVVVDKNEILNFDIFSDLNEELKIILENYGLSVNDIQVNVENPTHKYTGEEWQKIKENAEILKSQGFILGFEDQEKTWTIEEVEVANSKIQSTAQEIKDANLSPAETLLAVYMKVTSRKYTYESEDEHFSQSRSVYGVLNSDRIVCAGYAELMQAILDEIGNENIQVYQNIVSVERNGKTCYHQNLIVHIKDDKYGIDGWYYVDPTWDETNGTINYFLIPIDDIAQIQDKIGGVEQYTKHKRSASSRKMNSKGVVKNTTHMYKDPETYVSLSSNEAIYSRAMVEEIMEQNPYFIRDLNELIIKEKRRVIQEKIDENQLELEILLEAKKMIENGESIIGTEGIVDDLVKSGNLFAFKEFCDGNPDIQKDAEDKYADKVYKIRDRIEDELKLQINITKDVLETELKKPDPDPEVVRLAQEKIARLEQWKEITGNLVPEALWQMKEYAMHMNSVSDFDIDQWCYELILKMAEVSPYDVVATKYIKDFFIENISFNFQPLDDIIERRIQQTKAEIERQKIKMETVSYNVVSTVDDIMKLLNANETDIDDIFADLFDDTFDDTEEKKYLIKCCRQYLAEHSEAIPFEKMRMLVMMTIKKLHPELTTDEIVQAGEKIIEDTEKRARWSFKRGASNCFAQQ